MTALTVKEILAQLKKFGVEKTTDLDSYIKEYESYCMHKNPFTEKRGCDRIPIGENVKIASGNKFYTGTILNISEQGMFIGTKKCFSPNSIICIENGILRILAKVKRTTAMNGYYDGVGVELARPDENYLQFVNSLKAPQR